jgi:hypothetical protein
MNLIDGAGRPPDLSDMELSVYDSPMRFGRGIAWLMLAAAFAAAAAETAGRAVVGDVGYMSAHDLLYALIPAKLILFQAWVEDELGAQVWTQGLRPLLALPGWAIFVIPGLVLAWTCRTRTEDDADADAHRATYEDIVAAAREADQEEAAAMPSRYRDHRDFDPGRAPEEDFAALETSLDGTMAPKR